MNEMSSARNHVRDASVFLFKNRNLSSHAVKMQIEGARRLEPSRAQARREAKRRRKLARQKAEGAAAWERDRELLGRVRRAILGGDYDGFTPELFTESIDYLRDRGYTDDDIASTPIVDFPLLGSSTEVPEFNP